MRRTPAVLAIGASLLAIIAAVVWQANKRALDVTRAPVTLGAIEREVLVTGTLQPGKIVNVGSQVTGTLVSVDADFNSPVRAGQVLARLDPATFEAALEEARAEEARATARLDELTTVHEDVQRKLDRALQLAGEDLIPATELDAARLAVETAAANLKGARAEVRAADAEVSRERIALAQTIIRAPIDGVVVARLVEPGQTVTATVEAPVLFTIADLRRMRLLAEINEGEVGGTQPGTKVSFQVESLGAQRFEGTVSAVRLQPYVDSTAEAGASTPGSTSARAADTTIGIPSLTPLTRTTAQPVGTSGTSASTAGGTNPGSPSSGQGRGGSAGSNAPDARGAPATPAAGAVTYVALIEIDNPDGRLRPGGTAIVDMLTGQRQNVVRIPNAALTFRPTTEQLKETGQNERLLERQAASSADHTGHVAEVWRYEDGKFAAVTVELGLANAEWTELIGDALQPGDQLVTRAAVAR